MQDNTLVQMLSELGNYKHNREELMEHYVSERLSRSVENYYKELEDCVNFLIKKNELKLLRSMDKIWGD